MWFFCLGSAQYVGVGESARSSSFLGTNRAPPSFTDGRISSAIHRRTVLRESPVKRVISSARKNFGVSVICDPCDFGFLATGWFGRRLEDKVLGSLTRQQAHQCDQGIRRRRLAVLRDCWTTSAHATRKMPGRRQSVEMARSFSVLRRGVFQDRAHPTTQGILRKFDFERLARRLEEPN